MIAEPTLEHFVYYLRRVEGDTTKAARERRAAFERELGALIDHLEHLSGQAVPTWEWPQEIQDRRVSQRIKRVDWLDNPKTRRSYFVEARTYGDVYWLQVGYYQEEESDPSVFVGLRDEMWHPSAEEHLLGDSIYLCGIVANEVETLAARTLESYAGDSNPMLSTLLADGRTSLHTTSEQPHLTVIFYPDAKHEEEVSQAFLNDVALRLELYKHKVDRQLAWCEENLRILSEQEQALRDLLEKVDGAPQGSAQFLERLTQLYRVFSGNVGMLTERQMTVGINLGNLDAVLEELTPLGEDRLPSAARARLRGRQAQLEADLAFADHSRQQAERTIGALTTELALERPIGTLRTQGGATPIEWTGWPGAPPLIESEIEALTPHSKPSQSVIYPRIEVPPGVVRRLTAGDKTLLQQVYRGYTRVLVEKEFGGGFGGARVLRILPITPSGRSSARKVTKIGPATELRRERDNYVRYVEDHLPFCAARVEWARYHEQDDQSGLNYISVGGGSLGEVVDLEEYYLGVSPDSVGQIVKTLGDLLDRELGQNWYDQNDPLHCFFAAEYSRHMIGHLRLRLRQGSSDALWPVDQPPHEAEGYQCIEVEDIPYEYETKEAGELLSIKGMVVKKIKHGEVKLQDSTDQGIVVRVEFDPESDIVDGLELGSTVGVRGEVVYNRRGRMAWIVSSVFPELSPKVDEECIELPGVAGTYPNPLGVYPNKLGRILEGKKSYIHGDLNLRNVLVDESGKGWLIDFAKVETRHNLFDFIKLETYVRLMELGRDGYSLSLGDYIQFEEALTHATLRRKGDVSCPGNAQLQVAYHIILAIRSIAQKYMGREPDFGNEYFPALFLYCLAVMKYYQKTQPRPTRLVFSTACVLGKYLDKGGARQSKSILVNELSLVRELSVMLTPGSVSPPVQTRLQHLPFNDLTWEQFEALCAAVIEVSPQVIDCHLYGVQGDDQQGIDIVATQRGEVGKETWVYQCKRYREYTPAQLEKALAKMTYQADYYVLMLSIPATAALRKIDDKEPNLFLWDANDIARKLKNYPDIIEDFFGIAWRKAFHG